MLKEYSSKFSFLGNSVIAHATAPLHEQISFNPVSTAKMSLLRHLPSFHRDNPSKGLSLSMKHVFVV